MSFIPNKKFQEIRMASKDGNEGAMQVMQAYIKGADQNTIDDLVNRYYNIIPQEDNPAPENVEIEESSDMPAEVDLPVDTQENVDIVEPDIPAAVDLTAQLDKDMDGLIDEDEINPMSFTDFLGNKRKAADRAKRNADYFKIYDLEGRNAYMDDKKAEYAKKFDVNRRDNERQFGDIDHAITGYASFVGSLLDDDTELNSDLTSGAYDGITDDNVMKAFGRHWDQADNAQMEESLRQLVLKYGKKNVAAALNTLKNDNSAYRAYRDGQLDTAIGNYNKNIENLLK